MREPGYVPDGRLGEDSPLADVAAGQMAAESVVHEWPAVHHIDEIDSIGFANAAIKQLAGYINRQPALLKASGEGAHRGAETLSARSFQGVVESIQNADDLAATELRVGYRTSGTRRDLLIVHDGVPVKLANVAAMVLPFVSTKKDDASQSGRFGIGQMTLRSLGGPIEVHCRPYHFQVADQAPVVVAPEQSIPGFFDFDARETLLVVPLNNEVDLESLEDFVEGLGSQSLVFLRSVRCVSLTDLDSDELLVHHSLRHRDRRTTSLLVDGHTLHADVDVFEDEVRLQSYSRYLVEMPVDRGERRQHKATDATTPLGIAIPSVPEIGLLYDRVPLPVPCDLAVGLNAQFDPDTSRQTLREVSWNTHRFAQLGELLGAAAIDLYNNDPQLAWQAMPLRDEVPSSASEWLSSRYADDVISAAQRRLAENLAIGEPHAAAPIAEIVYENELLDAILTVEDQTKLVEGFCPVPLNHRDQYGRWRRVLDDLERSHCIDVEQGIEILDQDDEALGERTPEWFLAFAAAAESADCFSEFCWQPSILLHDGRRVLPPRATDPRALVIRGDPDALSTRLGLVDVIHSVYLGGDTQAETVCEALRRDGFLRDGYESDAESLLLLARGRWSQVALSDEELLILRDAFERLSDADQRDLGPRVGKVIQLRGFKYESGQRIDVAVSPANAYLPAKIDREKASFARAAAKTPGITWIHEEYDALLRRRDRQGIGAQRLLARLGAEVFPRLLPLPTEYERFRRDSRPVTDVHRYGRVELQMSEIRTLPRRAEYLIGDRYSPDLNAVISDIIAAAPAEVRRERAAALMRVIVRGWDRHFSEHASAQAVHALDGYFYDIGPVISTWLAHAASEPWMPSATGALKAPSSLHLQSEVNRITLGQKPSLYMMTIDDQVARSPALAALRLRSSQSADRLVSGLENLRDAKADLSPAEEREVLTTYKVLALQCESGGSQSTGRRQVDDLPLDALRQRFAGGRRSCGLIWSRGRWYRPDEILRGPAMFGSRRPFVPNHSSLGPLWAALQVRTPDAGDCLDVLRELAQSPLSSDEVAVVIESMALLASELETLSPQKRRRLKKLPLWDGRRWCSERPILAVTDDAIADELRRENIVWEPGFRIDGMGALLEALDVTYISSEDFEPVASGASGVAETGQLRSRFVRTVDHLRNDLARNDRELSGALGPSWQELAAAYIVIDDQLRVRAKVGNKYVFAATRYHMSRDPLTIYVRSWDDLGSDDAGGRAVAQLFSGDRQKLEWAWLSMWARASREDVSERIVLSTDSSPRDERDDRLTRLNLQSEERKREGKKPHKSKRTRPEAKPAPVIERPLKDPATLVCGKGSIVNQGARVGGVIVPPVVHLKKAARTIGTGDATGTDQSKPASVLPPTSKREQRAYEAVQKALSLDDAQINDLRAQRGVGADAIDDLRQYYEIKMASGSDFPNEITLTASEVERARDPDFFLAVVAGLESDAGRLRVRFIADPLHQLPWRMRNDLTLAGIREAQALEYVFEDARDSDG